MGSLKKLTGSHRSDSDESLLIAELIVDKRSRLLEEN